MKKLILILLALFLTLPVMAETVVFNTNTKKIHKISCPSAKKCTVNCIKIDRSEAVKKGGISCKVCGGK